jgi:histidinol dehydrogenase
MRTLTTKTDRKAILVLLNRRPRFQTAGPSELAGTVAVILNTVQNGGDAALCRYTAEFDRVQIAPENLQVKPAEFETAQKMVDAEFLTAIRRAKANILAYHTKQMPKDWLDLKENGVILGERYLPVATAGMYVPGGIAGSTPLVSSVLMNVLPAAVAGVARIVICTPPNRDGGVNPYLLAAAAECGVNEVYKAGGAQAIAAMAFGTESIAAVDVITGPGNQYVTEAKRQVFGYVGLDMLAGPSEILIIADAENDPAFIAADLLSQAEHGPVDEAGAFLITNSPELATAVNLEIERQLQQLSRTEIAMASLAAQGAIIIVSKFEEAFELANFCAPEHLELLVKDPWNYLSAIKHAGAVFIGPYSTEPIGDYVAGTNHVLPTNGTARFASGLNVNHFLKKSSIISYNQAGINADGPAAVTIARTEGLDAHAKAVEMRMRR